MQRGAWSWREGGSAGTLLRVPVLAERATSFTQDVLRLKGRDVRRAPTARVAISVRASASRRCDSRTAATVSQSSRSQTTAPVSTRPISYPFRSSGILQRHTSSRRRSCGELLDLNGGRRKEFDVVVATKFPSYLVRHAEERGWLVHQFRQAYELDRTPLGRLDEPARERACDEGAGSRPRRAWEASRSSGLAQRRGEGSRRSTALEAEVLPRPPQDSTTAARATRRASFLSVDPARPREAHRPPHRGCGERDGVEVVIAGDGPDRERLGGRARPASTDARASRATTSGARRPLRACLAVYTRGGQGLRHGWRLEGSSGEKPVVTTTDGRPARGGLGQRHQPRRPAGEGVQGRRARSARSRASRRGGDEWVAPATGLAHEHDIESLRREAPLVRFAFFEPMPPEQIKSPPTARFLNPALRRRASDVDGGPPRRAGGRPAAPTSALYHVGNNPDAHGVDRRRAGSRPRCRRAPRLRPAPPGRGNDARSRDSAMRISTCIEREHGVVGRLLAIRRHRQARAAAVGEPGRSTSRSRASSSSTRPGSSCTRATSATGRARQASTALMAVVPHPAWPVPDDRSGASRARGRPRLLRRRELEQADPRAPARDGGASADARRGDAAPGRPDLARIRPRPQAATARSGRSRCRAREVGVHEARLWVLMAGSDVLCESPAPHHGGDVGERRSAGSRSASRSSSATSAGSWSFPTPLRSRCRRTTTRSRR